MFPCIFAYNQPCDNTLVTLVALVAVKMATFASTKSAQAVACGQSGLIAPTGRVSGVRAVRCNAHLVTDVLQGKQLQRSVARCIQLNRYRSFPALIGAQVRCSRGQSGWLSRPTAKRFHAELFLGQASTFNRIARH